MAATSAFDTEPRLEFSVNETLVRLAPAAPMLRESLDAGWRAWRELKVRDPMGTAPLRKRARAAFVSDHIHANAEQLLDGVPGIRFHEDRGVTFVVIDDCVAVRLKLVDKFGRSSNYPTAHQRQLQAQQRLRGLSDWMVVTFGYTLNALQTEIADIVVSYRNDLRPSRSWCVSVGESHLVETLPLLRRVEAAHVAAGQAVFGAQRRVSGA